MFPLYGRKKRRPGWRICMRLACRSPSTLHVGVPVASYRAVYLAQFAPGRGHGDPGATVGVGRRRSRGSNDGVICRSAFGRKSADSALAHPHLQTLCAESRSYARTPWSLSHLLNCPVYRRGVETVLEPLSRTPLVGIAEHLTSLILDKEAL